jgi:hypothetical protein
VGAAAVAAVGTLIAWWTRAKDGQSARLVALEAFKDQAQEKFIELNRKLSNAENANALCAQREAEKEKLVKELQAELAEAHALIADQEEVIDELKRRLKIPIQPKRPRKARRTLGVDPSLDAPMADADPGDGPVNIDDVARQLRRQKDDEADKGDDQDPHA